MSIKQLLLMMLTIATVVLAGCHEPAPATGDESDHTSDETTDDASDAAAWEAAIDFTTAPSSTATLGETMSFTVDVTYEGPEGAASDHAGMHWAWNSTRDVEPLTGADFDGASNHTVTDLPGQYTFTWTPTEAGTYYVRPHVAYDGTNIWGPEYVIAVS